MTPTQIGNYIIFILPFFIMILDIIVHSIILENEVSLCNSSTTKQRASKIRHTESMTNLFNSLLYAIVFVISVYFLKLNTFVGNVYLLARAMEYPLYFLMAVFAVNKMYQYIEYQKKVRALIQAEGNNCAIRR